MATEETSINRNRFGALVFGVLVVAAVVGALSGWRFAFFTAFVPFALACNFFLATKMGSLGEIYEKLYGPIYRPILRWLRG